MRYMIGNEEGINNSPETSNEGRVHPLEEMPSFEEHMKEDFESPNDDTDESWIYDWDEGDGGFRAEEVSDEELLARDIDSGRRKRENIRQERAQELFESELKSTITNVEDLELLADVGEEGLSSETVKYGDKDVKVIHVAGYPLRFLKSSINASIVADNPEIWTKNASEYSSFSHRKGDTIIFDPDKGDVSNTICTTYVDTDRNPAAIQSGATGLVYIFTDIRPDSVTEAKATDAYSSPDSGFDRPKILAGDYVISPEEIAERGKTFNEVVLRRYDETGKPLLPTAIMTYDAIEPNERILKNAAYFDIPIIHIDKKAY